MSMLDSTLNSFINSSLQIVLQGSFISSGQNRFLRFVGFLEFLKFLGFLGFLQFLGFLWFLRFSGFSEFSRFSGSIEFLGYLEFLSFLKFLGSLQFPRFSEFVWFPYSINTKKTKHQVSLLNSILTSIINSTLQKVHQGSCIPTDQDSVPRVSGWSRIPEPSDPSLILSPRPFSILPSPSPHRGLDEEIIDEGRWQRSPSPSSIPSLTEFSRLRRSLIPSISVCPWKYLLSKNHNRIRTQLNPFWGVCQLSNARSNVNGVRSGRDGNELWLLIQAIGGRRLPRGWGGVVVLRGGFFGGRRLEGKEAKKNGQKLVATRARVRRIVIPVTTAATPLADAQFFY